MTETLWWIAFAALLINIPFGYWRAGARKFSLGWFTAIHAAVPIIAALRIVSGLGWRLESLVLLVPAYFLGQCVGGLIRRRVRPVAASSD